MVLTSIIIIVVCSIELNKYKSRPRQEGDQIGEALYSLGIFLCVIGLPLAWIEGHVAWNFLKAVDVLESPQYFQPAEGQDYNLAQGALV